MTFFREIQAAWDEVYPFVDEPVKEGAAALGLPRSAGGLSELVAKKDFPRLAAALTRVALDAGARDAVSERLAG